MNNGRWFFLFIFLIFLFLDVSFPSFSPSFSLLICPLENTEFDERFQLVSFASNAVLKHITFYSLLFRNNSFPINMRESILIQPVIFNTSQQYFSFISFIVSLYILFSRYICYYCCSYHTHESINWMGQMISIQVSITTNEE